MSRPDSERALRIYKTFTAQTEEVVKFLGVARHFEAATRLEIPNLKHASTDLARLLEDDLNDPDFELRRREYLAEKEAKKKGGRAPSSSNSTANKLALATKPMPSLPKTETKTESKAPPDLIDFFDSIEPQQPAAQQQQSAMQFQQASIQQQPVFYAPQVGFQQQPQQTGFGQPTPMGTPFAPQGNNPFGQPQAVQPLQQTPTGAGFGGYSPQPQTYGFQSSLAPIPQNDVAVFPQQQQQQQQQPIQPQSTNPFRQSTLVQSPAGAVNRHDTNPFARHSQQLNTGSPSAFSPGSMQQSQAFQPQQPQPLQIQRTGTNPFSRSASVPPQQTQGLQPLQPNPTGSTNPFRKSAFINQQTGQGWQVGGQQGSMGGLEQLETVPVFPRPGMA